jgi:hypothetical protein
MNNALFGIGMGKISPSLWLKNQTLRAFLCVQKQRDSVQKGCDFEATAYQVFGNL